MQPAWNILTTHLSSFAAAIRALEPGWNMRAGASLPRRVRIMIKAQEECSERLIGWIKLALVLVFAFLYVLAPRPSDAPARSLLDPVPLALAAYALFSAARLALSYRRSLPYWMVVNSVFIDMSVLLALIWSFHTQYDQPAAFSLKAPTFAFIFVFMVLRALRFDYRLVLVAGLAGAGGWALLLILALAQSSGAATTHDFVTYMTGNHILVGAEIEKIVALLVVTGLLTFVVRRAEVTLMTAVREETAYREIGRFLSGGIADAIRGADAIGPGQAVSRDAAILMLDLRGFTRLTAGAAPADVVRLLTSFHERIVPIVSAHGGVVDKYLGDGVMATFGAVAPCPTAAADALRAVDAIMAAAEAWSEGLPAPFERRGLGVNAAVTAGPVVFTTLGSADRLEYTVIGDAVNLAAKLEKHNKVAGTRALVTAAAYIRAIAQGYGRSGQLDNLPAQAIAGVPQALDLAIVAR